MSNPSPINSPAPASELMNPLRFGAPVVRSSWELGGVDSPCVPYVQRGGRGYADRPSNPGTGGMFPEVDSPYPLVNDVETLWLK